MGGGGVAPSFTTGGGGGGACEVYSRRKKLYPVFARCSKIVVHSNSVFQEDSLLQQADTLDSLYYCPFGALFMQGFYPHYLVDFFHATIAYVLFGRVLSVAGLCKDIIKLRGSQRSLYPFNRFISWHYPHKEEVPYKDDQCIWPVCLFESLC